MDISEAKFNELADRWDRETVNLSSVHEICRHEAYQQMVKTGKAGIQFAINRLKTNNEKTFDMTILLCDLTGISPWPKKDNGRVKKMAAAWLRWAKENGH